MSLLTVGLTGSHAVPAPTQPDVAFVHGTRLTVTATEFTLAPAALEVPARQPVEITFINKGASFHNWAAPDLAATGIQVISMPNDLPDVYIHEMTKLINEGHPMIAAGPHQSAVIRFTPLHGGTYQMLCTIPGHKETSMVGTLAVRFV
jgi:plastocyanin